MKKLKNEQGEKIIGFAEQIVLTELNSSTILHDEIPLTQFARRIGMDHEVCFNVTIKVCCYSKNLLCEHSPVLVKDQGIFKQGV